MSRVRSSLGSRHLAGDRVPGSEATADLTRMDGAYRSSLLVVGHIDEAVLDWHLAAGAASENWREHPSPVLPS